MGARASILTEYKDLAMFLARPIISPNLERVPVRGANRGGLESHLWNYTKQVKISDNAVTWAYSLFG